MSTTIIHIDHAADNFAIGVRRVRPDVTEVSFSDNRELTVVVNMSDLQAGKLLGGLLMAFPPKPATSAVQQ